MRGRSGTSLTGVSGMKAEMNKATLAWFASLSSHLPLICSPSSISFEHHVPSVTSLLISLVAVAFRPRFNDNLLCYFFQPVSVRCEDLLPRAI